MPSYNNTTRSIWFKNFENKQFLTTLNDCNFLRFRFQKKNITGTSKYVYFSVRLILLNFLYKRFSTLYKGNKSSQFLFFYCCHNHSNLYQLLGQTYRNKRLGQLVNLQHQKLPQLQQHKPERPLSEKPTHTSRKLTISERIAFQKHGNMQQRFQLLQNIRCKTGMLLMEPSG